MTGANTKAILGESKVEGVLLADGTTLPADLVVMAVGIRPNSALAKEAGLAVNRGIVVDAQMSHQRSGHLCTRRMCGGERCGVRPRGAALRHGATLWPRNSPTTSGAAFNPAATATRLKVTGINLYSAGDFAEGDDREEIVLRDATAGVYKRLVVKDDCVIGAVLYGDTADGPWFFDLMRKSTAHRRDARHADLRPGLPGRVRPGPFGGRCSLAG